MFFTFLSFNCNTLTSILLRNTLTSTLLRNTLKTILLRNTLTSLLLRNALTSLLLRNTPATHIVLFDVKRNTTAERNVVKGC